MVTIQSVHEGACSELGTAVGVHNAPRHVPVPLYSVFQGVYWLFIGGVWLVFESAGFEECSGDAVGGVLQVLG